MINRSLKHLRQSFRKLILKNLLLSDVGRLRLASFIDGISFVMLLGFSVLKRVADMPNVIRIPGMIHGGLFVTLCLAIMIAVISKKLPLKWAGITFLCSLIPFAPFLLDRKLRSFNVEGDS